MVPSKPLKTFIRASEYPVLVAGLGGIDIVTAVVRQIAELGFEKRGCSDLALVAVFIPHLRTFSLQLHS